MKLWAGIALASMALVGGTATAPAASAATEFGNGCGADDGLPPTSTVVQTGREGGPAGLPVGGVVTRWTVTSATEEGSLEILKLLQKSGNQFTVMAETSGEVKPGSNSYDVRIPVAAGYLIGLATTTPDGGVYECAKQSPGEKLSYIPVPNLAVGASASADPGEAPGRALPVRVRIEPDADGDGFGDESQDACPTNASTHDACPPPPAGGGSAPAPTQPHALALAVAHKRSVTVRVTSDLAGSASVRGKVKLGGGANATFNSGPKPVSAGETASFTLKFPRALKSKLAKLPAKQKLKLLLTVTATSTAGAVAKKSLSVRLRGQGRAIHST